MNWFERLLKPRRMERELDSELRFHFESQVADKVRAGLSASEARRMTRLEFGGLEQVKEECRESRGTLWLASIAQDLRFGGRILARSPGFSLTAILVLALGIGVNTLAFSLYNLLALQSIPVRDPQSLVSFERRSPENITPVIPWNSIVYYRDHSKTLSALLVTLGGAPLVLDQDVQRVKPSFVSANYFSELGATAAGGRLFDPIREDTAAAPPVVVLSYPFWQRRFAADPSILGKTVHLAGKPATIIGITSQSFANLSSREPPDLWLPLQQHSYFVDGSKAFDDPKFDGIITVTARLAPGATIPQAAQELLALTNQLRKLYPAVIWDKEYIRVFPGAHFLEFDSHAFPIVALAGVLVLLILAVACANLGGLLMARGVSRQHEIQIRLSIGARRSRIFRQLFTESLLLASLGSIAALPLSYLTLSLVLHYANAPTWMSAVPDWRVMVFTAVIGFIAALFFGLMPTLQMVKRTQGKTLAHQFVICAQVAASCVLLILAGLLVRATLHTIYTDPGFGYEQVLSIDSGLADHGYTPVKARAYLDQLQDRLRATPGVASVSMALRPPLVSDGVMITSIHVGGHTILIYPNWVGPDFFQTMGIPLLRGRYLVRGDKNAVVLSESLARKRWPSEDPIGKQWKDGKDIVVGVVGNTRAMELNNTDATELYAPATDENLPGMFVLVKTVGEPDELSPAIQSTTANLDANLFPTITPLKVGFQKNVATVEQIAAIISMLGSVAIFLAVVGLLGLVSYAVSQRTKEIAIRLALGADRTEIFSTVLRRFALPVLLGLVAGVGITAALSQVLRRFLYGISGLDPLSYVSAIALLIVILATAALLPVRRAFQLDIARVLHFE
jgi:predicted permease